jgi:hypothetical protein
LTIALGLRPETLVEDCDKADIVVNAAPLTACGKPRLALGAEEITRSAGYAVTFAPFRVIGINGWRGARPWVGDASPSPQ